MVHCPLLIPPSPSCRVLVTRVRVQPMLSSLSCSQRRFVTSSSAAADVIPKMATFMSALDYLMNHREHGTECTLIPLKIPTLHLVGALLFNVQL